MLSGVAFPFEGIWVFSFGFFSSISIDSKLYRSLFLQRFKTVKLLMMFEFWKCLQSNRCSNIAPFLSVPLWSAFCNSSEHLTWSLPYIGDALINRSNILIDDIHVECFRTFVFVIEIVSYLFNFAPFSCMSLLISTVYF